MANGGKPEANESLGGDGVGAEVLDLCGVTLRIARWDERAQATIDSLTSFVEMGLQEEGAATMRRR